jgi:hypothetical protein
MNRQLLIIVFFVMSFGYVKGQLYTPNGIIQGSSGNNNIGIGISNPTYRVHLKGSSYETSVVAIERDYLGWGGQLRFFTRFSSYALPINRTIGAILFSGTINSTTFGISSKIQAWTTENWSTNGAGSRLEFYTTQNGATQYTSNPQMIINHNGRVGIATINPNYELDVNGTINATNMLINGQPITAGGSSVWETSGDNIFFNTGRIGLGISAPSYRLHLKAAGSNYESSVLAIERDYMGYGGQIRFLVRNGGSIIPVNRMTGVLMFSGTIDNTTFRNTVKIQTKTTENWSSTGSGTRLEFYTTPNGALGYPSSPQMIINHNGRVGIATINPNYELDVNGTINATNMLINGQPITAGGSSVWETSGDNIFFNTGRIGIGFSNPQYKLSVDGTISASEVKVSITPNSDYVFEPDYNLRPLEELDAYIKDNKHLPDIPSAEEFKVNGVGLGEMDDMLLRKIEELTLYVLDLKREIEELKAIKKSNDNN